MCENPKKMTILSSREADIPHFRVQRLQDYYPGCKLFNTDSQYAIAHVPLKQLDCLEEGEVRYIYNLNIPCGECLECLTQKATEWSYRIVQECEWHVENCFITLTYEKSPGQLVPKDFTDFMKRLRKHLSKDDIKIRYFMCGEYGSQGKRPHFHCIIFGWRPKDLELLQIRGTELLYNSSLISKIWGKGFVSVGDVSQYSAKYCAKYLQKLQEIPKDWVQPYVRMSNRPGIGFKSIDAEQAAATDKIYVDGHYKSTPRYYLKVLEREHPELVDDLKKERMRVANEFGSTSSHSATSTLLSRDL